ncbi:MAG: hypothetical protein M3355_04490 [Actinomycetota bacterium]|nr:hypothetical protein [Actinomycetota bacterium]
MRESAWRAAGERGIWFDAERTRYALRDESAGARMAAVHAWRKQGPALRHFFENQRVPSAEAVA